MKTVGFCVVCKKPINIKMWNYGGVNEHSETCVDCWFDILDGTARKQEAARCRDRAEAK